MKILATDAKGLVLGIVETLAASGQVFPSAGPFQVDVADPAGTINVVPGTPDQKTATIFRANGSGKTGTVTVKVTDTSNGLSGSASFDVVAPLPPPPPAVPDTLTVSFTPEP
jgi:hypothetical protein